MKKILFLLTALIALTTCVSVQAATKQKVTERRQVGHFERIKLVGSPKIKYVQGTTESVVVTAPKELVKRVQTYVEGNRLVVSMKGGRISILNFGDTDAGKVVVTVTSPDLIGVELQGSGEFDCEGHLDTDNLNIQLKGSGDIDFKDIICDNLTVSVVGSGDLDIKKVIAHRASIELVGSGDVEISEQRVGNTKVELKGSGDVKLKLSDCGVVDTRLLGSGDITLSGTVRKHNSYQRGSGDVHTRSLHVVNKK